MNRITEIVIAAAIAQLAVDSTEFQSLLEVEVRHHSDRGPEVLAKAEAKRQRKMAKRRGITT